MKKLIKYWVFFVQFLKANSKSLRSFLTRIFSSFSLVMYSSLFNTIRCLVLTRLSWRNSCKTLPKLEEVDSKLTFSLIESIVPRQSGINTDPSSGLKSPFKWSMKIFTKLVSACTPAAGSQPKMNVKFEIFAFEIPWSYPPPLEGSTSSIWPSFISSFLIVFLLSKMKLSLQLAKRTKK